VIKFYIHYFFKRHHTNQWEVANELNMANYTLSCWLETELTPE